ncbi:hypothetical protein [Pseudoxanthomonas wuyuanensis]|nr:hypothetical protein [Pseudoxanthomonas wuyuanensis]KAF1720153.1 hypothetical protein CSC75_12420 [Pseudoxanthomonas wuyuanensis]
MSADTDAAFRSALSQLDTQVPRRAQGRRSHHTERYCAAHLLATLPTSRLSFPLRLTHGDKPDFVLELPETSIGIEHTEAVSENEAHAQFLREKEGLGPEVFFMSRAVPGEPRKSAARLRQEIKDDAWGDGWYGDSTEREWAIAMAYYVKQKLSKALAPGFLRHPQNWLMVYDNWPVPSVDYRNSASHLQPLLEAMDVFSVFDAIFVLDDAQMCEFRSTPIIYALRNPSDGHCPIRDTSGHADKDSTYRRR